MIKYLIMFITPFINTTAIAHDASYYSLHPVELQKLLEHCPNKQPNDVSCEALNDVALRANQLVFELQKSPQLFGQKILSLQEAKSMLEADLNRYPQKTELLTSIADHKQELGERLAIVKWLESPRG